MNPGTLREVNFNGHSVVLVRLSDKVHAIEGLCPHQGGILGEGRVQGNRIVCPEHGAEFRVSDGKVEVDPHGIDPPRGGSVPLEVFPTREVNGIVEVDVD